MNNNKRVGVRGNGKPTVSLLQQIERRNGKTMAAVMAEVHTELTVHPPASKEEVQAFLRLQIKRCRVNLVNAKDRGDLRAQANISRKMACYEYLSMVIAERQEANQSTKATRECPYCRVHSVDIFGYCHCCGRSTVGGENNG